MTTKQADKLIASGQTAARKLAKEAGMRVPRVGYERHLGDKLWLCSTGHAQFGWFESTAATPYELRRY